MEEGGFWAPGMLMVRLSDLEVGASCMYRDVGLKQVDKLLQVMVKLFGIGKVRERGQGIR